MAEYDGAENLKCWHIGSFGFKTKDGGNTTSYYYLKDHLGNIRVTVNQDGDIVTKDDYYPFGLRMGGMSYNAGNTNDRLKYSSKELDEGMGLSKYHFGWRDYDPEIGRWHVKDPLYWLTPGKTPYNYCSNDPVNRIDILGLGEPSGGWFYITHNGKVVFSCYVPKGWTVEVNHGNTETIESTAKREGDKKNSRFDSWGSDILDGGIDGDYLDAIHNSGRGGLPMGGGRRGRRGKSSKSVTEIWSEKVFGPKATKKDSWLWQAFRGTGNRQDDIFNATMLGLGSAVATVAAAEAAIYVFGDPFLAAGWEAAQAETYLGFTTAKIEATAIGNFALDVTYYTLNFYLLNKPGIDNSARSAGAAFGGGPKGAYSPNSNGWYIFWRSFWEYIRP